MRDSTKLVLAIGVPLAMIVWYQEGDNIRASLKKAATEPQSAPGPSRCDEAAATGKTWIVRDGEYREIDRSDLAEAQSYQWTDVCP